MYSFIIVVVVVYFCVVEHSAVPPLDTHQYHASTADTNQSSAGETPRGPSVLPQNFIYICALVVVCHLCICVHAEPPTTDAIFEY